MTRSRLDEVMVRRGFAPSRARARDAILRGCVRVSGSIAHKAGEAVAEDADIAIDDPALAWVSRAALKLIAGLEHFGIAVAGRTCLDIGASTGGFTQVLLSRGAARVYAVDVGHGQLHPDVAGAANVTSIEGRNARELTHADVPEPVDVIVADVSFISLTLALPAALRLAAPGARLVALVKPQFEVGRDALGKGGVVRDPAAARAAADSVGSWLESAGWRVSGIADSPIAGGDGNREFLIAAVRRADDGRD